jgi:hypothetical protein
MREIKAPDLNAPRYRPKCLDVLQKTFYKEFRKTHPKYAHLSDRVIKDIIREVNGKIWQTVIDERDGVELPEQLGYIFIGSCPAPKKENINYHLSAELKKAITHRNWESDQYLAKIFYTNSATKYRFVFSSVWGFSPVRQFSRTVAKHYPENFNKYLHVDDYKKINNVFRRKSIKMYLQQKDKITLETYNEFDL